MVISEQREGCGGDDGELPYFSHEVCIRLYSCAGAGCEQSAAQPKAAEWASLGSWEGCSEACEYKPPPLTCPLSIPPNLAPQLPCSVSLARGVPSLPRSVLCPWISVGVRRQLQFPG